MNKTKSFFTISFLLIANFLFSQTIDGMVEVDESKIPPSIKATYAKLNPEIAVDQWLYYKNIYDAKFVDAEQTKIYRFNRDGDLIEERVLIDWENAPENLKKGKELTQYKYWDVTELYEINKNGNVDAYFMKLENDKNEIKTIYFDESGNLDTKANSGR